MPTIELVHAPALPSTAQKSFRAAFLLSVIVAVMAAASSLVGLVFPRVYGDEKWLAMGLGNDLVTLVIAVPILIVALRFSARGSVLWRLLWLGSLYYMFYNYAFYIFGLPVTRLYLPLVAIFTLSLFALILGLASLDVLEIAGRFSPRTPARRVAGYMFFWAAMVSGLWISQWLRFVFAGKIPEVNGDPNAYRVIATVDLSFMVSLLIPAAYLLWQRRPWGYALGVVLNVQGALYTTVMLAVSVAGWLLAPGSRLVSWWFITCIVTCTASLLCLWGLLAGMDEGRSGTERP